MKPGSLFLWQHRTVWFLALLNRIQSYCPMEEVLFLCHLPLYLQRVGSPVTHFNLFCRTHPFSGFFQAPDRKKATCRDQSYGGCTIFSVSSQLLRLETQWEEAAVTVHSQQPANCQQDRKAQNTYPPPQNRADLSLVWEGAFYRPVFLHLHDICLVLPSQTLLYQDFKNVYIFNKTG